jgi:hypothetical protein
MKRRCHDDSPAARVVILSAAKNLAVTRTPLHVEFARPGAAIHHSRRREEWRAVGPVILSAAKNLAVTRTPPHIEFARPGAAIHHPRCRDESTAVGTVILSAAKNLVVLPPEHQLPVGCSLDSLMSPVVPACHLSTVNRERQ